METPTRSSSSTKGTQAEIEALRQEIDDLRVLAFRERGLLEAILDHSPHGIIVCDLEGKFILQNPAAGRIWAGSAAAESVDDWHRYRAFHPDGRPFAPEEWTMAQSLRTRQPVEAQEFRIQRFDDSFGVLLGSASPLFGTDGEMLGAVSVFADITALKEAEHERDRLEAALRQRVAELDAVARRAAGLHAITSSLSRAVTAEEVAQVVVSTVHDTLGASASVCYILDARANVLRLASHRGIAPQRVEVPLTESLPLTDAVRMGQPVWLESRKALLERYPDLPSLGLTQDALAAMTALPLLARHGVLGSIVFSFPESRKLDARDLEFLQTVAAQCVPALERARAFEAEVQARQQAEERQQRLQLLVETGTVLASSLGYRQGLDQLVRMVVPAVADWCAIDVLTEAGTIQRLAVHHPDPAKVQLAHDLREHYPEDPNARNGVYEVLRTGRTEWVREIPEELLRGTTRDEEHLRLILGLGLRSYICVPLLARGRVLGALSLVHAESGRLYSEEDVQYAEDLARRAAVAIDNALLFEEAQRREQEFRLLAETMPQLVWFSDPAGRVEYFNRNWYDYTGLTQEQSLGERWPEVLHPEDVNATLERWTQAVKDGEPYEMVNRFRSKSGEYRWFIVRAVPLRDDSNAIRKWFGTCTDIHEQRQAQREMEEQAETLEVINRVGATLAAELELDSLVQAVTDAATQLTGAQFGAFFYTMTDDRGEAFTLYAISGVPREKFARFPQPRNTAIFAPTFAGEGVVRIDDVTQDPRYGKNAPYHGMPEGHLPVRSYLALPVVSRTGAVIGGLLFGHGQPGVFTEKAEKLVVGLASQAAVAMDNASLFREAQRLIGALERSNAELDQFAYVASHDLKAPLRGIANLSQWIEEDLGEALTGDSRKQMDLLRGRVHRMESLIDGILSYSRAGRLRTPREQVDVKVLLAEVIELLAPKPPAEVIIASAMPTVVTERTPLQQVLLNLVNNGLKHAGRDDARVEVRCHELGDLCEFAVADNGPGIAPEYHERIWGIFQTLEARDKVENTGIGLSVVKKIVESRGGRAWVESAEGSGATFFFTWPKRERN